MPGCRAVPPGGAETLRVLLETAAARHEAAAEQLAAAALAAVVGTALGLPAGEAEAAAKECGLDATDVVNVIEALEQGGPPAAAEALEEAGAVEIAVRLMGAAAAHRIAKVTGAAGASDAAAPLARSLLFNLDDGNLRPSALRARSIEAAEALANTEPAAMVHSMHSHVKREMRGQLARYAPALQGVLSILDIISDIFIAVEYARADNWTRFAFVPCIIFIFLPWFAYAVGCVWFPPNCPSMPKNISSS